MPTRRNSTLTQVTPFIQDDGSVNGFVWKGTRNRAWDISDAWPPSVLPGEPVAPMFYSDVRTLESNPEVIFRVNFPSSDPKQYRYNSNVKDQISHIANPCPSEATMLNATKQKLLTKIAGVDFNAGEFLAGGGKQAMGMMTDMAGRFHHGFRDGLGGLRSDFNAWKAGKLKVPGVGFNGLPKRLSSYYLEYIYGWVPTLQDAIAAVEAAAEHALEPRWIKVTATWEVNHENIRGTTQDCRLTTANQFTNGRGRETSSFTRRVHWQAFVKKLAGDLDTLRRLGLLNPALVLWERKPLSFVFDWFLSVGNCLEAAGALVGVDVEHCMYSVLDYELRNFDFIRYSNPQPFSGVTTSPLPHRNWVAKRTYLRQPVELNSFTWPVLDPYGLFGAEGKRLGAACALGTQYFSKRRA